MNNGSIISLRGGRGFLFSSLCQGVWCARKPRNFCNSEKGRTGSTFLVNNVRESEEHRYISSPLVAKEMDEGAPRMWHYWSRKKRGTTVHSCWMRMDLPLPFSAYYCRSSIRICIAWPDPTAAGILLGISHMYAYICTKERERQYDGKGRYTHPFPPLFPWYI